MLNKNLVLLLIALTTSSCCGIKAAFTNHSPIEPTSEVSVAATNAANDVIMIYSLSEAEIAKSETGAQAVYFGSNSAKLSKSVILALSQKVLPEAKNSKTGKVVIEAHSDERGSAAYNQKLSEKRAKAVKDYLVKNGVKKIIIKTIGYGESKPVALGHDEESWSKNRRTVTISIKK